MPGRPSSIALLLAIASLPCAAQTPSVTPFTIAPLAANANYIRFGAPITFSGRVLPADATGTVTFAIDNLPPQPVPLTQQGVADYISFGDSITAATYIADPGQRYPNLVAQSLNRNLFNYGVPGYTACDVMPLEVLPFSIGESPATNPLYSLLIGTNDLRNFGVGEHEQVFNLCHQATLAWLGVPPASKVLTGTTTGNSTHFTLATTGAPAYLWYGIQSNASGSFTVAVDGAAPTFLTSTGSTTLGNGTNSYALLRIPVAVGAHTFDITTQSGTVNLLGMGSPAVSGGPTVLAGDIPNQTNGNTAGIAAYTADIQANIALLRADGLDIRFVVTRDAMPATPAEMMDAVHPNAIGLSEIAAAFQAVAPPTVTTLAAAASYSTSSLAMGNHGVSLNYSGDSHYAAANSATFPLVIYDPTSSVAIMSDNVIYPVQSPIILTATVPQPNASGLVNFVDEMGFLGSAWLNQPTAGAAQLTLPSLAAGVHTVSAQYQGDVHYNASSSAPITVTVSGTYTTTTLSSPATRYYAAASIPLVATVSPGYATGTVTFLDGPTGLGQSSVVAGVATLSNNSLVPGIHTLTAKFSGNATQDPSQSPKLSIEIDPNSTITSLSPLPGGSPYGTALALVAAVSPAYATGTVTFSDGAANIGQTVLPNATLIPSTLAPGQHTLTATYSGDIDDLPSISSPVNTLITLAPTAISLAPVAASNSYGAVLQLVATVTPAYATGTVTFLDGATNIGQIALPSSSLTVASLAPGIHNLTAIYSGDSFRVASTSAAILTTITQIAASVTLASLPTTINAGSPLTLTAAIIPATATGTVIFRDIVLGVLGQSTVTSGLATVTPRNPGPGIYSITASYSGDTFNTSATSAAVSTQVILNATTTTLTASTNSAAFGTSVILTANVAPTTVSGSVTFFDGSVILGNSLVSNGVATLASATLAPGSHSLHATYGGDTLYTSSASAVMTVAITSDPTTTTLTLAQSTVPANANVIANIRVASATTNPTGTISIRSSATTLATASLSNASNGSAYATLAFNAAILGLGQSPLAAYYDGDGYSQPSNSAPSSVTLTAIPTSVTLALSAQQVPLQSAITLTASLAATTGSITYLSNGIPIATVALGTSYSFTPAAVGTLTLTASYAANGLYAASTSAPQVLNIVPPLTASLSPQTVAAKPGATIPAILTLTPVSGFSGPIQTTCKTSAVFLTCAMTGPTAITSATTIPVQITIATTTASISRTDLVVLALLLPILTRKKLRRLYPLCLLALMLQGCAEGGNFNAIPPGGQTVTITTAVAGTTILATLAITISN